MVPELEDNTETDFECCMDGYVDMTVKVVKVANSMVSMTNEVFASMMPENL